MMGQRVQSSGSRGPEGCGSGGRGSPLAVCAARSPQSPGPNRGNSVHAAEAADFRTLGTLHSPGAWWAPPHNVLSLKPPPRSQATRRATRRFPEGHDHHGPRKAGPASCLLARCSGRCSPRTGFGGLRLVCQASRPPRPPSSLGLVSVKGGAQLQWEGNPKHNPKLSSGFLLWLWVIINHFALVSHLYNENNSLTSSTNRF